MEKNQVVSFRDYCKKNNLSLEIVGDNVLIYDTAAEATDLIWDDANEVFYCLRATRARNYDLPCTENKNGVIQMTNYDMIQYMSAPVTYMEMLKFIEYAKSKGLVTDDQIKHMKENMKKIYVTDFTQNSSNPNDLKQDY